MSSIYEAHGARSMHENLVYMMRTVAPMSQFFQLATQNVPEKPLSQSIYEYFKIFRRILKNPKRFACKAAFVTNFSQMLWNSK